MKRRTQVSRSAPTMRAAITVVVTSTCTGIIVNNVLVGEENEGLWENGCSGENADLTRDDPVFYFRGVIVRDRGQDLRFATT